MERNDRLPGVIPNEWEKKRLEQKSTPANKRAPAIGNCATNEIA